METFTRRITTLDIKQDALSRQSTKSASLTLDEWWRLQDTASSQKRDWQN